MKIIKGDLVYTDGVGTFILKRRYAYLYNLKGVLIQRSEIDKAFFDHMEKAGYKKDDCLSCKSKQRGTENPFLCEICRQAKLDFENTGDFGGLPDFTE